MSIQDARTTHNDNVVFNCLYKNNTLEAQSLYFSNTSNSNIIQAGTMYYLIVESFSIPSDTLPLFRFPPPIETGQADFVITIVSGGVDYVAPILYLPRTNIAGDRGIYSIQHFIDCLNFSIENAQDEFGNPLPPVNHIAFARNLTDYPFITIDVPENNTIEESGIFFSSSLQRLFEGFNYAFFGYDNEDRKDFRLIFAADADAFNIFPERESFYNWTDIRGVYLITQALPINEEHLTNNPNNGTDEKSKIIADFTPFRFDGNQIDRSPWQYRTDYPKLIDLRSDISIDRIDFTVDVQYTDNTVERLRIAPNAEAILKVRFVKRSLFNNEYNLTTLESRVKQLGLRNHHLGH